ncbi:MAG: ATP-binding protein [candidate division Zixibacteria bacterium]|nr:ATP-binding protein [candidate division Zixibacteria bacterium]
MQAEERLKRLGWFLPLRLASYVIIMAVVVVWMRYPTFLQPLIILYSLLTLGFTFTIASQRRLKLDSLTQALVALQFIFEISIESGIIYATGNVNSPFSGLFILTIVSAALAYRLIGTLVIASFVSFAYAFIVKFGYDQVGSVAFSFDSIASFLSIPEQVLYSIFLHVLIFFLIAFISGYLAERLSKQDKRLADASRALKRAQLETDDILRHLNSGLLTLDAQGYLIYFNRAAERILGYSEATVKGLLCSEVFAERMPYLSTALLDGLHSHLGYPRKEVEIIDNEGKVVPLGLSTSVLLEENGSLRGVIAIFSDLTEAKEMENKVRAADRMAAIGELSASIAHEIRNPLAAISGSVEVLNQELRLSGDNGRLMDLIVKESHRLGKILSEFLTYARIDRPVYRKVELCHIISDVIELVRHHDSYRPNITMSLNSQESTVYVFSDEDLIKHLLINLALNACESFEGVEGKVTFVVSLHPSGSIVDLCVQDDGPGIPEHIHDKVFQPFFSTKKEGTGLGLAIVHRIASSLRLQIGLESSYQNGTSFMIHFQGYPTGKTDNPREQYREKANLLPVGR